MAVDPGEGQGGGATAGAAGSSGFLSGSQRSSSYRYCAIMLRKNPGFTKLKLAQHGLSKFVSLCGRFGGMPCLFDNMIQER